MLLRLSVAAYCTKMAWLTFTSICKNGKKIKYLAYFLLSMHSSMTQFGRSVLCIIEHDVARHMRESDQLAKQNFHDISNIASDKLQE